MTSSYRFRQLARLVDVADICSPFLCTISGDEPAGDAGDAFNDLCIADELDPMAQIALVREGDRVAGWIGFDMFVSSTLNLQTGAVSDDRTTKVSACMETIAIDAVITADTSLLAVIPLICASPHPFLLVLKGSQFVGWVSDADLQKPPLQLCLFCLLLGIEVLLLEVVLQSPEAAVAAMPPKRRAKAEELYIARGHDCDRAGKPYARTLLECTNLVDKLTVFKRLVSVDAVAPSLLQKEFRSIIERLRNEIAHPRSNEWKPPLLPRKKLWPFIQWAEALEAELRSYLERPR